MGCALPVPQSCPDCTIHSQLAWYSRCPPPSIQIPAGLPAGEYVLGWRWDCEQSNQIWQSCSDVMITSA